MALTSTIFFCFCVIYICQAAVENAPKKDIHEFVFWPNGTVPFYINHSHFDKDQVNSIMTSLALFAFKTCLKFRPVLAEPRPADHVLVLQNPGALWQCSWGSAGHSIDEPHIVNLGYECLKPPKMELTVMRALGLPFEHNRASRDLFIDVQYENIIPGNVDLFAKAAKLPLDLRNLPYDVNSVLHFGDRDFSKNGHRTIIFKDHNVKQDRTGLSATDLRKIEIVYGPECLKRDRQDKIDLCQVYPGVARRKRDVETEQIDNLRVNRDITPPPSKNSNSTDVAVDILEDLGVKTEVEEIIDKVYKAASIAVENARKKYCNSSKNALRSIDSGSITKSIANLTGNVPSIVGIIESIAKFSQSLVGESLANLTAFCDAKFDFNAYSRYGCRPYSNDPRCPLYYKSTKSRVLFYHTQHRPVPYVSTQRGGNGKQYQYGRSGNVTEELKDEAEIKSRKKRSAHKESIENEGSAKIERRSSVGGRGSNQGDNKPILRDYTSVVGGKRERYAPIRRNDRRFRIYNRKDKKSDDNYSNSQEKVIFKKQEKYKDYTEDERSEKQSEEFRPSNKRNKKDDRETGTREKGVPHTVPLLKKNEEFYADRKWPGGIVRYVITDYTQYDLESLRDRIRKVNDILKVKTCVRVEEVTEDEGRRHHDFLVLDTSPDYVTGRVGGRQVFGSVELFEGVSHKQHTAMMVMAMLGFYFEVSRHDRDDYVVVHNRHVRPDKLHHFEKIRSDATLPLPYDYKSATHPSWQFWRRIGKKGISTVATYKDKDPDGSIMKSFGQNSQLLSDLDIVKINSVYGVKCFKRVTRDASDDE